MNSNKNLKRVAVIIFVAGTIFHAVYLAPLVVSNFVQGWKTISQPAYWRSANNNKNQRFANYIKFLKQNIPEDGKVVLPPKGMGPDVVGHLPYMQYFLGPRELINCTEIKCLADLIESDRYILMLDSKIFIGQGLIEDRSRLVMFDSDWGLVIPPNTIPIEKMETSTISSILDIISYLVLPLTWLAILIGAGFLVAQRLIYQWGLISKLAVGFGLSLGVISLLLYIPMVFGMGLTTTLIVLVTSTWSLFSYSLFKYWKPTERRPITITDLKNQIDIWLVTFVLLGVIVAVLSILKSYVSTDGIVLWGAKAYGIVYHDLSTGVTDWGTYTTKYPLNLILMISSFKVVFGEFLPASKLLFPGIYLGLLIISYDFLRQHIDKNIAGLSTLFLGTVPIIFTHSLLGMMNLPLGYYLATATMIVFSSYSEREKAVNQYSILLGGIFFALAAWTRPEGTITSLISILVLIAIGNVWWRRNQRIELIIFLTLPYTIFSIVWYLTSKLIYIKPSGTEKFISVAFEQVFRGKMYIGALQEIILYSANSVVKFRVWGVFGLVCTALLLYQIIRWKKSMPSLALTLIGVLTLILVLMIMYSGAYGPIATCDVSCLLRTGLDRYSIPGAILVWLGGVLSLFSNNKTNGK